MPSADMTAHELQAWLRAQYPKEDERHEWKGWHSLRHHVNGQAGEDVISYASALANMEGGALVLGVADKSLELVGTDFHDLTPEKLKFRLFDRCSNLPAEGLEVEEWVASDTQARVWVIRIPKHRPRQPVLAHGKAWQRVGETLLELHEDRRRAILAELIAGQDWSAEIVVGATLRDLDPAALAKAREKYAAKHQRERWASEIAGWSTEQFLAKATMTSHGQLTRAALLLLGRAESIDWLSPNPAEVLWKVPVDRIAEPFGPPFLLTTTEVGQRIRNPNIKLFPETELLAVE
ncbi:MAG: AlbA family DNA-binding domain-containing protein, partial [Giesbergeria sp.]